MIHVSDISKSFGTTTAVNRVSLDIAAGEVFGLLGPNGAGKTTTLSMMIGILTPDEGTITIGEGNPADPGVREAIGIAPQSLSLYEEMTAAENLSLLGKLYRKSAGRLKERVDWAIEFATLTDRRNDLVRTYSGGMKRRLNMAAALVHDPAVILFDEPTVGVDPQSRNHIFDSIEQLKDEGRTIIYTTHYMEEAQRLCDRVAIMDHGQILAMNSVGQLLTEHGGDTVVEGSIASANNSSGIPGIDENGNFEFRSERPLKQVMELADNGVDFRTLQIKEPDLESVFLNLTGRTLRDD